MNLFLEWKKIKRTGFVPAFWGGGILAAAVPLLNMAFRSELYLMLEEPPLPILLEANWQMMAMLNVLLVVVGACLLYHTEYADNAMQKMCSLPIREDSIFFGKTILTFFMSVLVLAMEAGAIAFCSCHWFKIRIDFYRELCKNFGYMLLLMLPCILLSLLISEACQNMWISLGIGVLCIFTATLLPTDSFFLSLFPFAAPFQTLTGADTATATHFLCAMVIELGILILTQLLFTKRRRAFA